MTQYGTWVSYSGDARIWLAAFLIAAAAGATIAGIRLRRPIRAVQPGPLGRTVMIVAWIASMVAFLICFVFYVQQYVHAYGSNASSPRDRIAPITLTAVVVFFVIIVARRSPDIRIEAGRGIPRRDSRTDDLRASLRPDRDGQDLPGDPAQPGLLPGPVLRASVPDRDHHAAAPAAVADGASDQGHVLFLRSDAGRIRGVGAVRIRLSVNRASHRAEHRLEAPGLRYRPHPVPAAAARVRAGAPAGWQRAGQARHAAAGVRLVRVRRDRGRSAAGWPASRDQCPAPGPAKAPADRRSCWRRAGHDAGSGLLLGGPCGGARRDYRRSPSCASRARRPTRAPPA